MEPVVILRGKTFELVAVQRGGDTGVYKSGNEFLRIGDAKKIRKDLTLHKKMEAAGLPVASLIAEGESGGQYYFIETSLGGKHLGKLFAEDMLESGTIAKEHFQILLKVAERFGEAQLKSTFEPQDFEEFSKGIHLAILLEELPQYRDAIESRFRKVTENLSVFPFVVSHGDFNPNNLYHAGVTDLEDSFHGPFGYDLVTALVHINYFPDSKDYEYFARYRFTSEQQVEYFKVIDSVSEDAGLLPLSRFREDFEFCRAVWCLVRMHQWPKIQKWRYDLFIRKFL